MTHNFALQTLQVLHQMITPRTALTIDMIHEKYCAEQLFLEHYLHDKSLAYSEPRVCFSGITGPGTTVVISEKSVASPHQLYFVYFGEKSQDRGLIILHRFKDSVSRVYHRTPDQNPQTEWIHNYLSNDFRHSFPQVVAS